MKKFILGAAAAMLTVAAFASPMHPPPCTAPGDIFGDPEDCTVFYVCNSMLLPEMYHCPTGLVFNDQLKVCDYPSADDCL